MLAYRLDKQIPAKKIIQDIQKLLSQQSENLDSLVLVVSLQKICKDVSIIPRLEYKDCLT